MSAGPAAVTATTTAPPVYVSGAGGAAQFNNSAGSAAVVLPLIGWAFTQAGTQVDFRNSLTNKFELVQPTFVAGRFTLDIDFDVANPLFGTTAALFVNQIITAVKLQREAGGSGYVVPSAVVTQIDDNVRIEGKPAIRLTCRANGSFTVT